ncbi:MAG: archaemetzincin family Zn-dependent metalloprotease [Candidatus Kryptonium sp.]
MGTDHPLFLKVSKVNICVVKIGEVEDFVISTLRSGLKINFGWGIKLIGALEIPAQSYNHLRKQFHSTTILRHIKNQIKTDDCFMVLGVASVDLYVEGLNFVFGEARPLDKICIISVYRLRPEFYNDKPNMKIFERRILTEAVHEIGHLFNLRHCSNPNCVMFFSNSIFDTDRKGFLFCSKCQSKLGILK